MGDAAERQAADVAGQAAQEPTSAPAPAQAHAALRQVRLHTGPRAAVAARALRARAFTVHRDIVLGEGGEADHRLLAHEITHVAQSDAAGKAPLRRDIVTDPATGNATGYEFRVGTEIREPFAREAVSLVADGTLSDADIRTLRRQALQRRGTIDDPERMFMAGLRDPANLIAFQGVGAAPGAAVTFPIATIRANYSHVVDIDRRASLPTSVDAPLNAAVTAASRLDLGTAGRQLDTAQRAAATEIVRQSGSFRAEGSALVAYAEASGVILSNVLRAMDRAASDSTAGDKVMAGSAYAIAAAGGHPVAGDIFDGRVKVDALIPRAFRRLPGVTADMAAMYVTAAQGSGLKGDTMYVQTGFDITSTSQRSTIIHELDHAGVDRAASPTGTVTFPAKVAVELRAYRTQARYVLTQMERQSAAERARTISGLSSEQPSIFYGALVLEAQTQPARFRPLAEPVLGAAPGPLALTPAQVGTVMSHTPAVIQAAVEAQIASAYGISATDPAVVEGLAGESIIHWIDRIGP